MTKTMKTTEDLLKQMQSSIDILVEDHGAMFATVIVTFLDGKQVELNDSLAAKRSMVTSCDAA